MRAHSPEVSIILPTYNRADTIRRAIQSVVDQTFQDWELLVIDDGSTDRTTELDLEVDPRITLIRQENQGVYVARNTGLRASRGRYIAFLDSDDEWLPHLLDLAIGFLKSSPEDQYVSLEFLREDSSYRMIRGAIVDVYLPTAKRIGSRALELPPGETDDYLRVFDSKQAIGPWGAKLLSEASASEAALYQGNIFHLTPWGYFGWLPTTVLTRHASSVVGEFDPSRRSAGDYAFQALLSRHFRTNLISVPSARKHERASAHEEVREDHLALGPNYYVFRTNRLYFFDQVHGSGPHADSEVSLIRRLYVYDTGRLAMELGMRNEALRHFTEAACLHRLLWRAYVLRILTFMCWSDRMTSRLYQLLRRLRFV
jgi:glycosyltransferase involved in cell wall biosynthesis